MKIGNEAGLYENSKPSAVKDCIFHTPPLRLTYTRQDQTSSTRSTGDDVSTLYLNPSLTVTHIVSVS